MIEIHAFRSFLFFPFIRYVCSGIKFVLLKKFSHLKRSKYVYMYILWGDRKQRFSMQKVYATWTDLKFLYYISLSLSLSLSPSLSLVASEYPRLPPRACILTAKAGRRAVRVAMARSRRIVECKRGKTNAARFPPAVVCSAMSLHPGKSRAALYLSIPSGVRDHRAHWRRL